LISGQGGVEHLQALLIEHPFRDQPVKPAEHLGAGADGDRAGNLGAMVLDFQRLAVAIQLAIRSAIHVAAAAMIELGLTE
jgi:hypothetical protein